MSVARGIAQARSYQGALTFLSIQLVFVCLVIGVESNSWWLGIGSMAAFGVFLSMTWSRILILVILSLCWSWLSFEIAQELGKGLWAYPVALVSFMMAYAINGAGAIGFDHSVPDYR